MTPQHKPLVAIDMDDVLAPYVVEIINRYNRDYNATVRLEDVYTLGHIGSRDAGWVHDAEDVHTFVRAFLSSEEAYQTCPITGTEQALKQLKKNYRLVLITGRAEQMEQVTKRWIGRHLPGVFEQLYHTGDGSKLETCRWIGARTIIDDNPRTVIECARGGIKALLFGEYPWVLGAKKDLPEGSMHVSNWEEVLEVLI